MDEIAALIDTVLRGTAPVTTAAGAPSKAQYLLDDTLREGVAKRAADLLAGFPLYPGVELV